MFLRSSVLLLAYVSGSDNDLAGPPGRFHSAFGRGIHGHRGPALVCKRGSDIAASGSRLSLKHVRFNLAAQHQSDYQANLPDQ